MNKKSIVTDFHEFVFFPAGLDVKWLVRSNFFLHRLLALGLGGLYWLRRGFCIIRQIFDSLLPFAVGSRSDHNSPVLKINEHFFSK